MIDPPGKLTTRDLAMFDRFGVGAELLAKAKVERISNLEARELLTINGRTGDMAGICFPYHDPRTGRRLSARVRRDNPEIEDGEEKNKYLSSYGDRRHLYFTPNAIDELADPTVAIVLVEAEKSALALCAWSERTGKKILPVAMGGCWGWRGRIGKAENANGERVDETGPLPELRYCVDRLTYILLDANCATNLKVQWARKSLVSNLKKIGAKVRILDLPGGDGINGPDDFLAVRGDEALAELFDSVSPEPTSEWRSLFHSYQEIMNAPPARFAIEGFLQEEGITLIGGLAGHGKTLCMLAMARALLEGGKLFHRFPVNQTAERVIYLIPEAALGPFSARLKTFHLEDHVRNERLFCRTLSAKDSLSLTDPRLLEAVRGADVFLDTAVRFMVGEENSATEQKLFAETLFNLQRAGARSITGAHHSPKSFSRDTFMTLENILRGSGDIGAMVVTCWGLAQIDPTENSIWIQNVKPRDFQPCEPFIIKGRPSINESGYFELTHPPGFAGSLADHKSADRKTGRPLVPGKNEKFAEAMALKEQGMSLRDIARKVGVSKSTVANWFSEDEEIQ